MIEAVVARRLEKKMGKPYVLEQYLNAVYFGNNAYGLQSAAEVYFGKSVEQLTMVEGAFLGGLIRNPTDYDPFVRPERARYRLRQALDRLVAVDRLTLAEAELQASQFVLPHGSAAAAAAGRRPLVLHRGGQGLPPQRLDDPRRDLPGAVQQAVPRRAAHLHDRGPLPRGLRP